MSIDSHLSELVRRHQAIEEAILAEVNHPASDDIKVHELKRKKLHLKDEIERLKHRPRPRRRTEAAEKRLPSERRGESVAPLLDDRGVSLLSQARRREG